MRTAKRMGRVLLFASALLVGPWLLASAIEPRPHADERMVDLLSSAFDDTRGGLLTADELGEGHDWDLLRLFPSGLPSHLVQSNLGPGIDGLERLPDTPVPPDRVLVVFLGDEEVQEVVFVKREPVDLGCLAAVRPELTPRSTLRVVAATTSATRGLEVLPAREPLRVCAAGRRLARRPPL